MRKFPRSRDDPKGVRKLRWLVLLGIQVLGLAQPALRLKVPIDPNAPAVILPEPPASIHVIVQFLDPPTPQTLQTLAQRGATTVGFIPDNAVLVTMNAAVSLAGLGVNFAAGLSPYQKISPLISDGDGSIVRGTYVVEFHPDVSLSTARQLMLNLSFELVENPDLASRHLLVRIPDLTREGESLARLAAQDEVAYIFPASTELVQGHPVGVDLPVAPGLLLASGEVLGQIVSTFGDGWEGPGKNPVTLNYFFTRLTSQLADVVTQSEIVRALDEWAKVAQITWILDATATADRTGQHPVCARRSWRRLPLRWTRGRSGPHILSVAARYGTPRGRHAF